MASGEAWGKHWQEKNTLRTASLGDPGAWAWGLGRGVGLRGWIFNGTFFLFGGKVKKKIKQGNLYGNFGWISPRNRVFFWGWGWGWGLVIE